MGGRVEGSCLPRGRIWGKHVGTGTMLERGHPVDEASLGGALRGRSPRTREGRIGPTAQNCSSQQSVVSGWSEAWGKLGEGNGGGA